MNIEQKPLNLSPFLAQFVSQYHAKVHKQQYPRAAEAILDSTYKGVGTGPAGPVLAGPLFNSLAYMVKQNCMFEKNRQ